MATCIPIKMGPGGIPASLNPGDQAALPVDTSGFPQPVLKKYPLFEDRFLSPDELTPNLPDEAYEYMAAMIREAADRVPPDQMKRFLCALSPQAKRRLDPFLGGNLSKAERLFAKMKNSLPVFDWSVPLTDNDVAQFLSFDYEVGLMKKEAFEILGKHFPFSLPCPETVTVNIVSPEIADRNGLLLAQARFGGIFLPLPSANRASLRMSIQAVIHETAHAVRYLLHQQAIPQGMGHAVLPLWYEEAFALEAAGEIGKFARPAIWSHRLLEGEAPRPQPTEGWSDANYEFGAAFHAVWTERLGASAWHELSQEFFAGKTDLYKAIAEVAARHGQAGFENKTAVLATVSSWIDRVAGEITDPMVDAYREIAGRRSVEFIGSRLSDFFGYARTLSQGQHDLPERIAQFMSEHPNSPLNIQLHAILMVGAVESGRPSEASEHLEAISALVSHYGIEEADLHDKLIRFDALIALMTLDYERFDAAIGSLVLPMDSFYARQVNSELLPWHLKALHHDPDLPEEFKKSLFGK